MNNENVEKEEFKGQESKTNSSQNEQRRFYKGGTEEDPLNIANVGIGEEDLKREREEEAAEIQGHFPRDPSDPLGIDRERRLIKDTNKQLREYYPNTREQIPKYCEDLISNHSSDTYPGAEKLSTLQSFPSTHIGPMSPKRSKTTPKNEKKIALSKKYRYGNFDKYYGTRLRPGEKDNRLNLMPKEWFYKRNVLDIGCNVGYLTLTIAHDYEPRRIQGIDIDEHLIGVARKNIRHYCDKNIQFIGKFPSSFVNHGALTQPSTSFSVKFPDNIWFRTENYVFDDEFMNEHGFEMAKPQYHVILALSITKWVHLNWGDVGMERFFRRAFAELLPGGRFILEPQELNSYQKRAKTLPELWQNYTRIKLKPSNFKDFLLNEVGFERVEEIGVPEAKSKGFSRPIEVYYKSGTFSSV